MSEPFLSEIRIFAGDFAPRGWMLCQGQIILISSNEALYSLLGSSYGGDGRSNFALPDLRGCTPISAGSAAAGRSQYREGQSGGAESVALRVEQMPSHSHVVSATATVALSASTEQATEHVPVAGAFLGEGFFARTQQHLVESYVPAAQGRPEFQLGGVESHVEMDVQSTGNGTAHSNMQPWVALNYIIAVQGLYPPRN